MDDATRYGCGSFNRIWKASPHRDEFIRLYERFVAEVIAPHLGSTSLLYQAAPVFRVFLPGHLGVGPRHTDAGYHLQPNEINFWVPLTDACGTNSLMVESRAHAADFEPVVARCGEAFRFRGNECEHYTELNVSGSTRVSFDFRVIRQQELPTHPVPMAPADDAPNEAWRGAASYFTVGRYYKLLDLEPPSASATRGAAAGEAPLSAPPATASVADR